MGTTNEMNSDDIDMAAASKDSIQILAENLIQAMQNSVDCKNQPLLAKRSGVGQSTIGRIIRCEADATTSIVFKLAKALRVMPYQLLIDIDSPKSKIKALDSDSALDFIMENTSDWDEEDFTLLIGSLRALRANASRKR